MINNHQIKFSECTKQFMLILFFIFTINSQLQICDKYEIIPGKDCTFCYQQATDSDQNFQVDYCIGGFQCLLWHTTPQNTPVCIQWKRKKLNQKQCLEYCCDNSVDQVFTNKNYASCTAGKQIYSKITQGDLLGIVFFLLSLVTCCTLVTINTDRQKTIKVNKNKKSDQTHLVLYVKQPSVKKEDQSKWFKVNKCVQATSDWLNNCSQKQICAICLDEDETDCKTACRHRFHVQCLMAWIKRSQICPLCSTKKFNPITVECQKCHQMSYSLQLTKWNQHNDLVRQLKHFGKIMCDQCLTKHKQKICQQKLTIYSKVVMAREQST